MPITKAFIFKAKVGQLLAATLWSMEPQKVKQFGFSNIEMKQYLKINLNFLLYMSTYFDEIKCHL